MRVRLAAAASPTAQGNRRDTTAAGRCRAACPVLCTAADAAAAGLWGAPLPGRLLLLPPLLPPLPLLLLRQG